MLALTDRAVEAVKDIVSSSEEAPQTSGLRWTADQDGGRAGFKLKLVPIPAEDDQIIDEQGARVFVDAQAAQLLDHKVLDARIDEHEVAFTFIDQPQS